jgi:hypothetical protein
VGREREREGRKGAEDRGEVREIEKRVGGGDREEIEGKGGGGAEIERWAVEEAGGLVSVVGVTAKNERASVHMSYLNFEARRTRGNHSIAKAWPAALTPPN